ncbi:hypothetical protein QOZ89_42995 [Pseudofrankia sp. BMG5.37]|nr:hypothetical protein [Pseudofrankia sp. BMG5.37]
MDGDGFPYAVGYRGGADGWKIGSWYAGDDATGMGGTGDGDADGGTGVEWTGCTP